MAALSDGVGNRRDRVRNLLIAPLAAAAALVFGLPTLLLPLHPDQALFAMVGKAIGEGRFPYVDAWDFKSPGLYLIYAAAIRGPFELSHNVRAFNLGWTAVSAALIAALGARWWNWRAGLIGGLVYGLVCAADTPWWQSGQPDSLVVLPLILALLLYESANGRPGRLILVGAALGFAFQVRFNIALLMPFFPFVELMQAERGVRVRLWLQRMAWLVVGFLAVQALLATYLSIGGALGEYITTLRYAAGYTRLGGEWSPIAGPTLGSYFTVLRQAFWNWANPRIVLTLPGLATGFYGAAVLRDRRLQQLTLFVLLAYAGIALQAKFFWYHYWYMVPILALMGGWAWDRLLRALGRSQSAAIALLTTGMVALVLLLGSTAVWDTGANDWRAFIRYYRRPAERKASPLSGPASQRMIAAYVRSRTRPGGSIYVWGFDPGIYLYADRASASRFLLSYPLMSDWAPRRWQSEFIAELEARRPAYIILQRVQPGHWIVGHDIGLVEYVERFPAFQRLLATEYEQETEMEEHVLYRRR